MLSPQRPTAARAGCVAEARSNNEQVARSLDGLPSLVPLSAFATDICPKLQSGISERVNLLRFVKLALTFSNRARPESRRFVSRLGPSVNFLGHVVEAGQIRMDPDKVEAVHN
jgi:hypothetical protein